MHFVIFTAPVFSANATEIIAALVRVPDVHVGIISQEAEELLPADLHAKIAAHWRIDNVLDEAALVNAARQLTARVGLPVHRLFGANEQAQVPMAQARVQLGIPGMSVAAAHNFRDKAQMKKLFRENGIPCARGGQIESETEAWEFAKRSGYPLILKPLAGAGAQNTFRVDTPEQLQAALQQARPVPAQPMLIEEFVIGNEHSFETISIDGKRLWHSINHYYPTPLEVLRNPWMQWVVVLPREVEDARYDDIRSAAFRALDTLGMETGLTHLEWFRRMDGSIAISEVAARPPGARFTSLISHACDTDFVFDWCRLMVHDAFDPPIRRYAAGAAYLRAQGQGTIKAVHGLAAVQDKFGDMIVEVKTPQPGQPTASIYEGEGYLILRHEKTETVKQALDEIVSMVYIEHY